MIRLQMKPLTRIEDAWSDLQTAIGVEFGTLPPYLYAMFSIPPGENVTAASLIKSVLMQEMIHMCLACNILNALGGSPRLTAPTYPGPLAGDIGPVGEPALVISLLPLSKAAMKQGMDIEQPVDIPDFPVKGLMAQPPAGTGTIGQFYARLDAYLSTLPAGAWHRDRNQITDDQFFAGQIFAINNYDDAHRAIDEIVSEGEGAKDDPLDFQEELAHYYRFGEIFHDKVLTRTARPPGWQWGPEPLGVDWKLVYPAIPNPGSHDFSKDSQAARDAQAACNQAFSRMVDALQQAVTGTQGALGNAVRAMFDLRLAAKVALHTPLADGKQVAGPAFLYVPPPKAGASS
jgi:ferritin-like protein